ncbi:MAG: GDSL-type esterase/lipase family protein [Eubacteriales bacterium]|nr:GDSL-type esterase/lipase family protein [Eubacteriales bacterium]
MKTVLCFGDSNTYGYRPDNGERYPSDIRWTGILKNELREKNIDVIEEGLVGRTTVFEDNIRVGRKGSDFLIPIIESHAPVDTLVLMLGTNDCKVRYKASAQVIGLGIENLLSQVKNYDKRIEILLMSPIYLGEHVWEEKFDPEFDEESIQTSKKLADVYKKIADKYGCRFLAASEVAAPSEADQEHMDSFGHRALADAVRKQIA